MSLSDRLRTLFIAFCILGSLPCHSRSVEIFHLGTKDHSFKEFLHPELAHGPVVYNVGSSITSRDWPAYQQGSFDSAVTRSTMEEDWIHANKSPRSIAQPAESFQIVFKLLSNPEGSYVLQLDAIFRYRRPAAPKLVIAINEQPAGSYQLSPRPAPSLWWPNGGEGNGNLQYFGYESVKITLPITLLKQGKNTLRFRCVDGFGIYYDHLSLENDRKAIPPSISEAYIQPTIFYKDRPSGLVELARVHLRTTKSLPKSVFAYSVGTFQGTVQVDQKEAGDFDAEVEVPVSNEARIATLSDSSGILLFSGAFVPSRKWRVFALPMEQADFGYNDVPARTLEWENRFIDKALQIQERFPSYSFTLDAAANLESYLTTREEKYSDQVLAYLRSGKWGMNSLYANFFTGLASPEELFQMLRYSQEASRAHNFRLDSASQTDEPSITWALPQILASAGIKYLSNGSDPIRGALNPIGLLNFRSPFYWESPNGSKVLTWSGVSYTALDDMTWAGWSEAAMQSGTYTPSILGLSRSMPLFLSQYERPEYPFDATFLFGLHNDEIPMRHWGDADVLEAWNREYAYPKIVAGTQRDFFEYITSNFDTKIETIRGDGGAYWEDEAGADANVAAMVRTSQDQLVAAEKFESLAHWLKPQLKFDTASFDQAWTNIMLADSYVWSDANSFRRPYSARTRLGEAAHRAWAAAGFQQTGDLLLKAADKVAEMVNTPHQGFVVLNPESWDRSDLFEVEIELNETLIDPATAQPLPCASIKRLNGYQKVRCWAAGVPALGYRFYRIDKGNVSSPKLLDLNGRVSVESPYYKLQLSSGTGGVAHVFDRQTGLDLVNGSEVYGLNEYLYVTGGDPGAFIPGSFKDNRILASDLTLPLPELRLHRSKMTAAPVAYQYPWGTEIVVRSSAPNTPEIMTTITLFNQEKRISFQNVVHKAATLKKEAIYFAFPFSLVQPRVNYQSATAWVDPQRDMLPGANLQWFAIQGGVWMSGTNNSVGWASADAPLVTFGDINRGLWPSSIKIKNGTVFSYVMNNYWYTDTPAQQGGQFTFRYSLTSGPRTSATDVLRLSAETRSPLVPIRRYSMGWEPTQPQEGRGFLTAGPSGVRVLTIRPLDHVRDSFLIRLQNSTAAKLHAELNFSGIEVAEAFRATPIGDRIDVLDTSSTGITIPLGSYDIQTIIVQVRRRP